MAIISELKQNFVIEGEDVEGDYIFFEFYGTMDQAQIECEKTLEFAGGGHLDIFDEEGNFIDDVEW